MKKFLVCVTFFVLPVVFFSEARAIASDSTKGRSEESMASNAPSFFPEVAGRNLEGLEFQLPADFGGAVNLVLVAFRREHQALVDTWLPPAAALADSLGDLQYYELPVLSRAYKLLRRFIDGGMRAGISDLAARERTITLYIDKKPFLKALGISNEDTIYILVLASDGRVTLMLDGAYSEEKRSSVYGAARELLDSPSRSSNEEQAPN